MDAESMKQLINGHREAMEKYTKLDLERLNNVTYLDEFDREVQYVSKLSEKPTLY